MKVKLVSRGDGYRTYDVTNGTKVYVVRNNVVRDRWTVVRANVTLEEYRNEWVSVVEACEKFAKENLEEAE